MRTKRAKITWFLVGLNVLYFLLEILLGGSDNINTIYTLGALVPQVVVQGEVWRLLTANFLHYSWLHLFVNMIGLYF